MSIAGNHTREFGQWLTQNLGNNHQYSVYCGHGIKSVDKNLLKIYGFYGEKEANRRNILTNLDVMIVNELKNEVIVLIEIEESNMEPKKLLGDIFATLMCNRFAVTIQGTKKYYELSPKTHLLIAGVVSREGYGQDKIKNTIMTRLDQFTVPEDSIQFDHLKIIFGEDVKDTINVLKSEMGIFLSQF